MALTPIADEHGDIATNGDGDFDPDGEYVIESLGDPALDRVWLKCHDHETKVRQLAADVKRVEAAIERLPTRLFWGAVFLALGFALFVRLTR